jgi:hypothetical protein
MVRHLEDHGTATREELAAAAGAAGQVAQRQLQYAVDLGFIVEADRGDDGETRYTLPVSRETAPPPAPPEKRVETPADCVFDPSPHTVDEVRAHLEGADDRERRRVLDAERAGRARVSLVGE